MVSILMDPRDFCILIPGISKYVAVCPPGILADVTKDLERELILYYLGRPNLIT